MKITSLLIGTAFLSLSAVGLAAENDGADWPHAADIPDPRPAPTALAGDGPPDITRFLKIQPALSAGDQDVLSPDGAQLIYKSRITGEPQLWIADVDGGWPRQLTYGTGITYAAWLPDGSGILYAADQDGDEREGYTIISPDGMRERVVKQNADAFLSFGGFSPDGTRAVYSSTERNGDDFDIYVLDLEEGTSRRVYEGRFGFFAEAWQPDGNLVAVRETRGEDANDLHLLDVETGDVKTLFAPKVSSAYRSIEWLPDGDSFFMITNHKRDLAGIAHYDLQDEKLEWVETPDHEIDDLALSADGRYLAWLTNEGGYSELHVRDRQSGETIVAPELPRGRLGIDFAAEAPVLAIRVAGPRTPGSFWVWDLADGSATRVTKPQIAGIDLSALVVPESVTFKARDGVTLHGLLYMPEGVERPPVLIDVHGGPSAQARPEFEAVTQYLVARGIAVLDLNFRGSTGFGKKFARLDNKRLRPNAVRDIADAVRWLEETGRVDADRVAIMGNSYGGYLVNAALGAFPDMFVAGVSRVGVSDWVRALETASPALKASDREEYGDITDPDDRAFFKEISPINNAGKIKTPLLVMHGANDPRDPVAESDHFVSAIREAGGDVVYLRFPDEGHGVRRMKNRVHAARRVAAFLEDEFGLKPAVEAPQESP